MKQKNTLIIRNAAISDFGGGERFPVFLAKILTDCGLNVTIVSRSPSVLKFATMQHVPSIKGWWLRKQNWSGISYLLFPLYLLWQAVLFSYYSFLFVHKNVDTVHIQSKDDFIAATLVGHILRKRIVWTDHADLKHILLNTDRPLRNLSGKLVRWAMRYAHAVTIVSESERSMVASHLTKSPELTKKLHVVYNGAFDHFKAGNKVQDNSKINILFAGRIVTDKGIGEAIEAMRSLATSHPHITLDIIGSGPEADKYREVASGIPSITFHGHQDDPSLWMKKADIFIQPTYHEGFSLVLVEASMMQLPIIATNVGGNPEIVIDDNTGILIPPKDAVSLAKSITRLADDPGLRERLSTNARKQYLDKFQFDRIVKEEFIPLYEKDSY